MANRGTRNGGVFWWSDDASEEVNDLPLGVGSLSSSSWRAFRVGTTRTALTSQYGGQYGFSLVIEGYENILTDAADASKVVTAWSGTGWSAALSGLKIGGVFKQEIRPWADDIDVPTMQFRIMDSDGTDAFGKAVWKTKPTFKSRLTSTFTPAADGSGTLTIQSNATLGGTGTVHIGGKAHSYTSLTGSTQINIPAGGSQKYAPFEAGSSNKIGKRFQVPANYNHDISASPEVTDIPRKWVGRKVGLYIHRIVGGVWDTRAQAQLEFAGKIVDIADSDDGHTILVCHDLRENIKKAVIGKNQWRGHVRSGIYLQENILFNAFEDHNGTVTQATASVKVGASGSDEIEEGYYEMEEFISLLNNWLADAGFTNDVSVSLATAREAGVRVTFAVEKSGSADVEFTFSTNFEPIIAALGFTSYSTGTAYGTYHVQQRKASNASIFLTGDVAPYRTKLGGQGSRRNGKMDIYIDLDSTEGSWVNQRDTLPNSLLGSAYAAGINLGLIEAAGEYFFVEYVDATTLRVLSNANTFLNRVNETKLGRWVTFDDEDQAVPIRQVIVLAGAFDDVVTKLLASIDGLGVNHEDYDVYPWGAGVPWDLLGDDFLASAKSIAAQSGDSSVVLVVEKPTRLIDLLIPELAIRLAWIVFKDGGFRLATLPTPSSVTADHTLNENNKADSDGQAMLSTSVQTDEFLRNVVKIEYGRTVDGKFLNSLTVQDQASVDEHGESAITLEAMSSYGKAEELGFSLEALAVAINTRAFPHFAKPLKTVSRSIAPSLYHAAPGDTVSLTDSYARSPESGERGTTSRGGVILSIAHSYGHENGELYGEATILLTDEDRVYPLSPACEVDTTYTSGLYTNGYDDTNFRLRIKQHQFSKSTETTDVNRFAAADLIRILELDPADTASPDAWSRTVDSISSGSDYIQLTASISSPAWSGSATKRIVIIPQAYSSVQASQKTYAFQADYGDGFIQDAISPNVYGEISPTSFATASTTTLPALLADETYGDGKPFAPLHIQNANIGLNNLVNYKTAPHMPMMFDTIMSTNAIAVYSLVMVFPFSIGSVAPPGKVRYIKVAPFFCTTNAANTATVRVTSCATPPKSGAASLEYIGQTQSVSWTSTSTSFAEGAVKDLRPIRSSTFAGQTFLVVELKASDSSYLSQLYGLSTLYLGPLE